jgi:hypothetical protein
MEGAAVRWHTMTRKVDRHGERQNYDQCCRNRRPVTFDEAVCHEPSRLSESCDATCRGVKCRIQWFHKLNIGLTRQ